MKKAIVVGATSGIGRGLAKILVQHNYKVGITGRRQELLEEIKKENSENFVVRNFDISDYLKSILCLEELAEELGGLDLLIISSGTGFLSESVDYSIEKITIDTNVTGFTLVADWAFNYFLKQNKGHIIGISSIAGIRGNQYALGYGATKAYQINYLEALRFKAHHLKAPIVVTDIRPGFVNTAMAQSDKIFWLSTVEKASKQIYTAIQRKRKVVYVTNRWRIVALLMKILPRFILKNI